MKKIILIGIIILSLTGCFKRTVHPDNVTKNIMKKYNIQYLKTDEKPKEWVCDFILSDNFTIHLEIDKNNKYEQIKKDVLNIENNQYIKLFSTNDFAIIEGNNPARNHSYGATTIGNSAYCSAEISNGSPYYKSYTACMKELQSWNYNQLQASKRKANINELLSSKTLNTKNVFYTVLNCKHFDGYYLGSISWAKLELKYGFIEPNNSNKAYFYTSYGIGKESNSNIFHIKRMTEKSLIYKTVTLLDSNKIPYNYISDEYSKDKL